jgi:AcrR family transcriptional regulator
MAKKSTFLKLKEKEREKRRTLILEAATHLFSTKNFSEIGMRDIAEEAGISPASIYRYFPNRDAILLEVLGQDINEGKIRQLKKLEQGAKSLEEFGIGIVDFFFDKESTLHMLTHFLLNEKVAPPILNQFKLNQKFFLEHFAGVLKNIGITIPNIQEFAEIFFGSIFGIIITFKNSLEQDREKAKKDIYNIVKSACQIFDRYLKTIKNN